jgi:cell division septum initiation protein DivIVA
MEKIKGVIFLLESLFKNSKKQLLGKQLVVNPEDVFSLLEKLSDAVNEFEQMHEAQKEQMARLDQFDFHDDNQESQTQLIDIQKEMVRLKKDANDYADSVLSRLQLSITKLQQNVIKMEKNITEGRKLIQQNQMSQMKGDAHEA